ncbi:metal-dependent hydrolase [Marinobacter sp. LV10MA510-1]|uniref:metal-dependent hydrolase n=1 Tax=Marinobacter sp. LV10MA510-1 TaxID=1415567 RepID=UPI000BF5C42E|nr:metal-dependent hydrolase [Marinobacter sp. LV10MA510-1]PFG10954.1 inner membrane protein [Marinobacter sp. LV10MA510-1]
MDSITQVALGASIAGLIAGKTLGRSVLLTGALLGTLPDMDVLIDYGSAVANFTQHRGFSHSLFVLAPLSLLLATLFWHWKPQLGFPRWLLLTALVLLTHPILDTFTTYGTQLFWPLGRPLAISSVFIIDPLYTLPLLAGCAAFLLRPKAVRAIAAGLVLSTGYLGWSLAAQQVIIERVQPALAEAGFADAKLLVQPMPFNTVLWRATAITDQQRVEIVTGFLDGDSPLTLEYFPRQPALVNSVAQLPETHRLEWFTRGFLDYQARDGEITATDVRLGIPGAHPFTFVLANEQGGILKPGNGEQAPRPAFNSAAMPLLWGRITGAIPVLCLASLATPAPGQEC